MYGKKHIQLSRCVKRLAHRSSHESQTDKNSKGQWDVSGGEWWACKMKVLDEGFRFESRLLTFSVSGAYLSQLDSDPVLNLCSFLLNDLCFLGAHQDLYSKEKNTDRGSRLKLYGHKWTSLWGLSSFCPPSIPVFPAAPLISLSRRLSLGSDWSGPDTSCTASSQIRWFVCWRISAFAPCHESVNAGEIQHRRDARHMWVLTDKVCSLRRRPKTMTELSGIKRQV